MKKTILQIGTTIMKKKRRCGGGTKYFEVINNKQEVHLAVIYQGYVFYADPFT